MSTLVAHMLNAEVLITLAVQVALTLESVQQTLVAAASTGQHALEAIPFPAVQSAVPNLFNNYPTSCGENVASLFSTFTTMLNSRNCKTKTWLAPKATVPYEIISNGTDALANSWKSMAFLKQTAMTGLNGTFTSFMTRAGHILDTTRTSKLVNPSPAWKFASSSKPISSPPLPSWTITPVHEPFEPFGFSNPCVLEPTPWLSGKNIFLVILLLIIFALTMFICYTYLLLGVRTLAFFSGITGQALRLRRNLLVAKENIELEKENDELCSHLEWYRQQSLLWKHEKERLEAQVMELALKLQREWTRNGDLEPESEQEW